MVLLPYGMQRNLSADQGNHLTNQMSLSYPIICYTPVYHLALDMEAQRDCITGTRLYQTYYNSICAALENYRLWPINTPVGAKHSTLFTSKSMNSRKKEVNILLNDIGVAFFLYKLTDGFP